MAIGLTNSSLLFISFNTILFADLGPRPGSLAINFIKSRFEQELKLNGLWEEYQNRLHNEGVDKFIEGYNSWLEEMLTSSNQGFVTEAGDVENWKGSINEDLASKSISETIKYLESLKK